MANPKQPKQPDQKPQGSKDALERAAQRGPGDTGLDVDPNLDPNILDDVTEGEARGAKAPQSPQGDDDEARETEAPKR